MDVCSNKFSCQQVECLFPQQGDAEADKVVACVVTFATKLPEARQDECESAVEDIMLFLLDHCMCLRKDIRLRACQILALLMKALPPDGDLSLDLCNKMESVLSERVADSYAPIRAVASRALARLAVPGEVRESIRLHLSNHDIFTFWFTVLKSFQRLLWLEYQGENIVEEAYIQCLQTEKNKV